MPLMQDLKCQLEMLGPSFKADPRDLYLALALLDHGQDAFSRHHFIPGHFTASAFVFNSARQLLLIDHPKLKKWLQPGGHIERRDKNAFEAAVRELEEETVLRKEQIRLVGDHVFDVDVHDIPAFGTEPAHKHFDLRFAFVLDGPLPIGLPSSSGLPPFRWMSEALLKELSDASVITSYRRALKLLGI